MSDSAPALKAFSQRLLESGKTFLKGLPALLALLMAACAVIVLFAGILPDMAKFNASLEAGRKPMAIEVRETDLPIKCIRGTTIIDSAFLGAFSRQRGVDQDGKHYLVHEVIKRVEGQRYPCRDSAFDAAYVEEIAVPANTADKNQGG